MGLQREAHVTFKNILRCSSLAALPQLLPLGVARLTYADINLAAKRKKQKPQTSAHSALAVLSA